MSLMSLLASGQFWKGTPPRCTPLLYALLLGALRCPGVGNYKGGALFEKEGLAQTAARVYLEYKCP